MDPRRFDTLARSLTTAASRRSALVALMVGVAASVAPGLDAATTRRRRRGQGRSGQAATERNHRNHGDHVRTEKKNPKKGKKKKNKKPSSPVPGPAPGPASCVLDCSGGRNCGGNGCGGLCGSCTAPQTCSGGGTAGVCGSGSCTPVCTNLDTGFPRSCGSDGCGGLCGSSGANSGLCVDGQVCKADGNCGCPPENPDLCDGCRDLKTDELHCGFCGNNCNPGLTCCNGRCVNLERDSANCGACGRVCPQGPGGATFACCRPGVCSTDTYPPNTCEA
jgi:hypothetical protein